MKPKKKTQEQIRVYAATRKAEQRQRDRELLARIGLRSLEGLMALVRKSDKTPGEIAAILTQI